MVFGYQLINNFMEIGIRAVKGSDVWQGNTHIIIDLTMNSI